MHIAPPSKKLLCDIQIFCFIVFFWWTLSHLPPLQQNTFSIFVLLLTFAICLGAFRAIKQHQHIEQLHLDLLSLKWQVDTQRNNVENTLEKALIQEGFPELLTKDILLHLSSHETHMIRVLQERRSRPLWEGYTHPVFSICHTLAALGIVSVPLLIIQICLPEPWRYYATPSITCCILTVATIMEFGKNHPTTVSNVVIVNSILIFANITLYYLLQLVAYG